MSVTGKRGAGIPIVLLHDATGGTISIELKNGCVYRGLLDDVQDNMNCMLKVWYLHFLLFISSLFSLFVVVINRNVQKQLLMARKQQ